MEEVEMEEVDVVKIDMEKGDMTKIEIEKVYLGKIGVEKINMEGVEVEKVEGKGGMEQVDVDMEKGDEKGDTEKVDMMEVDIEKVDEKADMEKGDVEKVDEKADMEKRDVENVDKGEVDEKADMEKRDVEKVDKEEVNAENVDMEKVDEKVDKEEVNAENVDMEEIDTDEGEDMGPSPLDIVPVEVWELIFYHLSTTSKSELELEPAIQSDLKMCSLTCSIFKEILEPSKPQWLFAEIVPMLAPYIKVKGLVDLRRVCKSWKRSIDTFLEFSERYYAIQKSKNGYTTYSQSIVYSFTLPVKISRFLTEMHNHPRNPFAGRTLEIRYCNSAVQPFHQQPHYHESFWNNFATPLLQCFGQGIFHLRLDLRFGTGTIKTLQNVLTLCPNLRSLSLKGHLGGPNNEIQNQQEFTQGLPKLEYLTSLKLQTTPMMGGNNSFPGHFQYEIASKYAEQLTQVKVSFADEPESTLNLAKMVLPVCEDLEVSVANEAQLGLVFPVDNVANDEEEDDDDDEEVKEGIKFIKIVLVERDCTHEEFHLANILAPLENLKKSLKCLEIVNSRQKIISLVRKEDLEALKGFDNLVHLNLQGFDFGNEKMLPYLTANLESLELSGSTRHRWAGWMSASLDIPYLDTYETRKLMWRQLPKLSRFILHDFQAQVVYDYYRDWHETVECLVQRHYSSQRKIFQFETAPEREDEREESEDGDFENRYFAKWQVAKVIGSILIVLMIGSGLAFTFF